MNIRSGYRGLLEFATLIRMAWVPVLVISLIGYGIFWYTRAPVIPPGVTVEAKAAAEVRRETTVPVAVAVPLQVYKPAVKAKLKLPSVVIQDEAKHVVAASKTANDERQHTVTTTLDTKTGEFTSYDRVEPLPWLTPNTKTEIGVFYGIKGGTPILRLQAQQEFLQAKALHLGVTGTLDSDASYFVGVGAWARW